MKITGTGFFLLVAFSFDLGEISGNWLLCGYWVWCRDPCAKPCVSDQKHVDYCRETNFGQVSNTHSSCPFVLANMAAEEVARFVVGNESVMCKAALAGDAPRGCSVASRSEACSFDRFNT